MFDISFPAYTFVNLFLEVETRSRTLIQLFTPGSVNICSASRDDCNRVFPDELRVSSFSDRFPLYALTAT